MRNINIYIKEKLVINKDTKAISDTQQEEIIDKQQNCEIIEIKDKINSFIISPPGNPLSVDRMKPNHKYSYFII